MGKSTNTPSKHPFILINALVVTLVWDMKIAKIHLLLLLISTLIFLVEMV